MAATRDASAAADKLVRDVGKLRAVTVPRDGGTLGSKPERNRSPVGLELVTCTVATPGGGGAAVGKLRVVLAAAVAVAMATAGAGVIVVKVPPRDGPRPMKPATSIGKRLTVYGMAGPS